MNEVLYLNKKRVDLFSKLVTRKLQIGDIGDVSARKSTYSYSIKLPITSKNTQILDMLGIQGNTSRKPFEKVVADYIVDGIPLVINGVAIIRGTSGNYEVNIYDGIIDLSERLKGKKLSDLPLSEFNHFLSSQLVVDSFENTSGYIYALANFGLGLSTTVAAQNIAPSMYVHTVFRKIFESNGINLVGDFFTTNQKFLTEVIPPVKGYEIQDIVANSFFRGGVSTNTVQEFQTSQSTLFSENKFTLTNNSLVNMSLSNNEVTINVSGKYRFDFAINYNATDTFLGVRMELNGSGVSYFSLGFGEGSQNGVISRSVLLNLQAGDVVRFFSYAHSGYGENYDYDDFGGVDGGESFYILNYSVNATLTIYELQGGEVIDISESIGDLGQLEFVKDVIQRYGLVLHPIKNTSDYRFRQFENVLTDRSGAEDWTSKFNLQKGEKYSSGYAKINHFKYKYPEEIVIANNDGELVVDNENAISEKTILTSIFQIPNTASSLSGQTVYHVPIWGRDDENNTEYLEAQPSVMRIERVDMNINVRLFSEATGISATENIPFLSLNQMSMQYFIAKNYTALNGVLDNYKKISLILNLSIIDVFNLDFFRLKYFKQLGRFYYLNSLTHTPSKMAKAEMIEIAQFPENQPPSEVGSYSFNMGVDSSRTITAENILTGYSDPEFDEALKVKFTGGFNSNILLRQAGIAITSETEILIADLDLTAFDTVGGLGGGSESWTFKIADVGSEEYSEQEGTLTANVIQLTNQPPVAEAGSNQTVRLYPEEFNEDLFVYVSGSNSYDNTGEIVSYLWTVDSQPASSNATLTRDISSPLATLRLPSNNNNAGTYVLRLRVTDEYGLWNEDTVQISVAPTELEQGEL